MQLTAKNHHYQLFKEDFTTMYIAVQFVSLGFKPQIIDTPCCHQGLPQWLRAKESAMQERLDPWLGKNPMEEGTGNPLSILA